jgi:UDP-N-acetylmuramate--alanine ligase
MSGLALIAHELGAEVTGSDRSESSYVARLREHGIDPVLYHAAENVPAGAEVVYSTAVAPENPERAVAGRELHRADLLAEIAALRRCLAVTGTHGKTTTAAMVVHALAGAGMDPSYVVGGELRSTGSNAGWGGGEWIVIEADESDRSLLKVNPEIAVLTNAELDHHATYSSRLDLEDTLRTFMARARGAAVWDRPQLRALCPADALAYDALDLVLAPEGSAFAWRGITVSLIVPGAHNAVNGAGALTAAALAGAEPQRAAEALASFRGARRRLEPVGETAAGARVYDDYAHHPTEVAAVLAAARTLAAPGRVVAVFQPHLYSRTQALAGRFGAALAAADLVVVLPVYPAREAAADFPGVEGNLIAAAAADTPARPPVAWMPGFEPARRYLATHLRRHDVCMVMGAGNVDVLARALVA